MSADFAFFNNAADGFADKAFGIFLFEDFVCLAEAGHTHSRAVKPAVDFAVNSLPGKGFVCSVKSLALFSVRKPDNVVVTALRINFAKRFHILLFLGFHDFFFVVGIGGFMGYFRQKRVIRKQIEIFIVQHRNAGLSV